jgi:16S rRNA (guanine527-N7)-methyltransferase
MAVPYFDFNKKELSLIDVGTGAGFPGIPLKIAFPHLKVTLLDSLNKRLNFLNEVINELGLNEDGGSIETVH